MRLTEAEYLTAKLSFSQRTVAELEVVRTICVLGALRAEKNVIITTASMTTFNSSTESASLS